MPSRYTGLICSIDSISCCLRMRLSRASSLCKVGVRAVMGNLSLKICITMYAILSPYGHIKLYVGGKKKSRKEGYKMSACPFYNVEWAGTHFIRKITKFP